MARKRPQDNIDSPKLASIADDGMTIISTTDPKVRDALYERWGDEFLQWSKKPESRSISQFCCEKGILYCVFQVWRSRSKVLDEKVELGKQIIASRRYIKAEDGNMDYNFFSFYQAALSEEYRDIRKLNSDFKVEELRRIEDNKAEIQKKLNLTSQSITVKVEKITIDDASSNDSEPQQIQTKAVSETID